MCLTPLSDILNCTGKGYCLSNSPVAVNHLVYMGDLKLYGCSQAEVESIVHTSNIYFSIICMDIGAAKCSVVAVLKNILQKQMTLGYLLGI